MEVKLLTFAGFVVLCSSYQAHVSASDTRIREKRSSCGGQIRSSQGEIRSPNYPSSYPSYVLCIWYITAPQNSRIRLNFTDFLVEGSTNCQFAYLEVRDGRFSSSNLLGIFCGSHMPGSFESTGNAITIKLKTGSSAQYRGFKAEYSHVIPCGEELTSDEGDVASPNYPQNYAENENCKWSIWLPGDSQIMLRFRSFQLESSRFCDADSLRVYDGRDEHSPLLGTFCGTDTRDVVSSGNRMTIIFSSDSTANYRGFSAQYSKVKPVAAVVALSAAKRNIPALLMVGAIACFAFRAST